TTNSDRQAYNDSPGTGGRWSADDRRASPLAFVAAPPSPPMSVQPRAGGRVDGGSCHHSNAIGGQKRRQLRRVRGGGGTFLHVLIRDGLDHLCLGYCRA